MGANNLATVVQNWQADGKDTINDGQIVNELWGTQDGGYLLGPKRMWYLYDLSIAGLGHDRCHKAFDTPAALERNDPSFREVLALSGLTST